MSANWGIAQVESLAVAYRMGDSSGSRGLPALRPRHFAGGLSSTDDGQVIDDLLDSRNLSSVFLSKLFGIVRRNVASDQQHSFFEFALDVLRTDLCS